MRKPKIPLLVIITVVFSAFMLGFLWGKNQNHDVVSVNVPQSMLMEPTQTQETEIVTAEVKKVIEFPIDVNRCDKEDLMALPGIGEVLADRILIYREENGSFSAVEELLNVDGIGKKRLEEIWNLIVIGG